MIRLPDTLYYKINSLLLSSSSKPNKKKKSKYLEKTNLESCRTRADLVLDFLRFPWFGGGFRYRFLRGDVVWELLFSFLLINQNTKSRSSSSFDDFNYPNTEQNRVLPPTPITLEIFPPRATFRGRTLCLRYTSTQLPRGHLSFCFRLPGDFRNALKLTSEICFFGLIRASKLLIGIIWACCVQKP